MLSRQRLVRAGGYLRHLCMRPQRVRNYGLGMRSPGKGRRAIAVDTASPEPDSGQDDHLEMTSVFLSIMCFGPGGQEHRWYCLTQTEGREASSSTTILHRGQQVLPRELLLLLKATVPFRMLNCRKKNQCSSGQATQWLDGALKEVSENQPRPSFPLPSLAG